MKSERLVCFTNPCEGCEIATLSTDQAKIVAAQGVDYVLKHSAIVRPFATEVEMLAASGAAEYGVQGAQPEITAAATRALNDECSSRAN